ncbi:putative phage abortive infection protein [Chitinophaga sp. S165]|uniref:putative phage abortive infection protein n=1 Tax=Chitinophaga sp. S165 TaxID=2135462 RepID=UPI000D70FFEE|nr:putative phage abortive infection protein [Chitinophaga sp. S165]PWV46450.1 putative phage abortive infection protein [Chitinophaga sp. S165]
MSFDSDSIKLLVKSWFKKLSSIIHSPILIGLGGFLIIIGFVYWVAHFPFWIHDSKNYQIYCDTGQIGDTLGGIMGPPIAILGVILTFLAFFIQYRANAEQRQQFERSMVQQQQHFEKTLKEQSKTHKLEQIENRFFELLKIHKENINELTFSDEINGRTLFRVMHHELRVIYQLLKGGVKDASGQYIFKPHNSISEMELLELAYFIFFYGIQIASSKQNIEKLSDFQKEMFNSSMQYFRKIRNDQKRIKRLNASRKTFRFSYIDPANNKIKTCLFENVPFNGYDNKLGHLYRHLFRSCQYILNQEILDFEQKREYIKMLRAQLSNYEQVMIYYNAIVWFKGQWDELFIHYQFIHNIPLDIIKIGPAIEDLYKNEIIVVWENYGEYMFEHQQFRPAG